MYRHVVLFCVRDGIDEATITESVSRLRALGGSDHVSAWSVAISLDDRKGTVIVEDATFSDVEAFRAWRGTDQHRQVADWMSAVSDWWVGDWETASV